MHTQLQNLLAWQEIGRSRSLRYYTCGGMIRRVSRVARLAGRGLQTLGRRLQRAGQRLAGEEAPARIGTPQPAER